MAYLARPFLIGGLGQPNSQLLDIHISLIGAFQHLLELLLLVGEFVLRVALHLKQCLSVGISER
jgi:hypothetical protein